MEAKEKFLLISVSVFLTLLVCPVLAAPDDLKIYDSLFGGKQIFGIPLIQSVNNSGCSGAPSLGSFSCGSSSATSGTLPAADQTKWHKVYISSSGTLNISMNGPSGTDFDLLIFSACGSGSICSSTSTGSTEKCTISASAGNYYYIAVYSFTGSGSYSLNAALSCAAPPSCDSSSYSSCSSAYSLGNNSAKSGMCGASQYYKFTTAKNCTINWTMTPQSGSDFDLYAKYSSGSCPSTSSWNCRPYKGSGSSETCSAFLPAGTYYALVNKYSGTGSYSINALAYNCTTACTNHSSYSCYNNDVYWYNSCSQRQEMKQDCGDSSNGSWSANYCRSGNVYHNRTVYSKGCSGSSCYSTTSVTSELVQNCGGYGCANGTCVRPLNVSIINYTPSIENNFTGCIQWNATGSVKETGIYFAYSSDKSDSKKVAVPLNNYSVYNAIVAPRYGSCITYVRAYAIANNGSVQYTSWKSISSAEFCGNASASTSAIGTQGIFTCYLDGGASAFCPYCGVDNVTLAVMIFKPLIVNMSALAANISDFKNSEVANWTIGGCMHEGLFTVSCAIDVLPFVPGGVLEAGMTKVFKAFSATSKGAEILKASKTLLGFTNFVKEERLTIKGTEYTVDAAKMKRMEELGLAHIAETELVIAGFDEASGWLMKNGEAEIVRLKNSGAGTDLIEAVMVHGGKNLYEVRYAGRDMNNVARWVENGDDYWGWTHIWKRHVEPGGTGTKFLEITSDTSEENVKKIIFDTLKDPNTLIKESASKYCYFSNTITNGYRVLVVVDKYAVNGRGGLGAITTAYPMPADNLNCN